MKLCKSVQLKITIFVIMYCTYCSLQSNINPNFLRRATDMQLLLQVVCMFCHMYFSYTYRKKNPEVMINPVFFHYPINYCSVRAYSLSFCQQPESSKPKRFVAAGAIGRPHEKRICINSN